VRRPNSMAILALLRWARAAQTPCDQCDLRALQPLVAGAPVLRPRHPLLDLAGRFGGLPLCSAFRLPLASGFLAGGQWLLGLVLFPALVCCARAGCVASGAAINAMPTIAAVRIDFIIIASLGGVRTSRTVATSWHRLRHYALLEAFQVWEWQIIPPSKQPSSSNDRCP